MKHSLNAIIIKFHKLTINTSNCVTMLMNKLQNYTNYGQSTTFLLSRFENVKSNQQESKLNTEK